MGMLAWLAVALAAGLWVGGLVGVMTAHAFRHGTQLSWTIVVVFLGPLGGLLYFFIGLPRPAELDLEAVPSDRRSRLAAIANPWQEPVMLGRETWWDGPE